MPEGTPPWLATPAGIILAGTTHYFRRNLATMGDHRLSPRTYLVGIETGGVLG
jgi:hypothetical protein